MKELGAFPHMKLLYLLQNRSLIHGWQSINGKPVGSGSIQSRMGCKNVESSLNISSITKSDCGCLRNMRATRCCFSDDGIGVLTPSPLYESRCRFVIPSKRLNSFNTILSSGSQPSILHCLDGLEWSTKIG